jgi:hypothetical protein
VLLFKLLALFLAAAAWEQASHCGCCCHCYRLYSVLTWVVWKRESSESVSTVTDSGVLAVLPKGLTARGEGRAGGVKSKAGSSAAQSSQQSLGSSNQASFYNAVWLPCLAVVGGAMKYSRPGHGGPTPVALPRPTAQPGPYLSAWPAEACPSWQR